jgi:UDP-2-acetamido-3-amino-2,3-dideoxy-glucuronate N-acetyltransferase
MVRTVGLIGGGYWGKNLIKTFNEIESLHTVCEINEELQKFYKTHYPYVKITGNYDDMLNNSEITSICCSLPAPMHYEFSLRALNAGKHVFIEKPITLNTDHAQHLITVANAKNLHIMVGHLLHYHDSVKLIKQYISDGHLGDIRHIISNRQSHGILRSFENVLWSFAPHDISVALSLVGLQHEKLDITDMTCSGSKSLGTDVHDVVNSSMMVNGVYVNINVNWLSPYKEQKMTIVGTEGMIVFDDVAKTLVLYDKPTALDTSGTVIANKNGKSKIITPESQYSPLYNECSHFVNLCKGNVENVTNGNEGLRTLFVLRNFDEILNSKNNISSDLNSVLSVIDEDANVPMHTENPSDFMHHITSEVDEGALIGTNSKIWHWTHITKSAKIGENCNVGQCCYIAGELGNGCKIGNGVNVWLGVKCANNVFVAPSVVFTNDINPRCAHSKGGEYVETIVEEHATIGANSTIRCGIIIGKQSLIGCGAVVTKDVPPYHIVVGNPATSIGTIDEFGNRTLFKNEVSL